MSLEFTDPIDLSPEERQETPPTLRIRPDKSPDQGLLNGHTAPPAQPINGTHVTMHEVPPDHHVAPSRDAHVYISEPVVHVSQPPALSEADNAVAEVLRPEHVYVIDKNSSTSQQEAALTEFFSREGAAPVKPAVKGVSDAFNLLIDKSH